MIAELIAVGNEVVDGSVINTNASWLAQELSRQGVTVRFHSVIPDEEVLMRQAFQNAQGRADLMLVTGGLGPTVDDFTLEVAAEFFERPLVQDALSLERIQKFFKKIKRPMTPNQERQAMLPEGGTVLANPLGTAPGVYLEHRGVHWAFFPGVPAEMKGMFAERLLPILEKLPGRGEIRLMKVLRCFGLPEGQMDDRLRTELQGRLNLMGTDLGFRVRFPTIDIRLTSRAREATAAFQALREAEQVVRQRLGDCIFGEAEEELAQVVGRLLKEKGLRIATAESCTGGLLASQITDVPGASDYFLEGIVTYSNQAKASLLGVQSETLESYGAVSAQTALEMARGIVERSQAEFGIGVTGIAGPGGGTPDKPVGTVHIAVKHLGGEWEHAYRFPFGRERFKQVAAATALDRVRRILLGKD